MSLWTTIALSLFLSQITPNAAVTNNRRHYICPVFSRWLRLRYDTVPREVNGTSKSLSPSRTILYITDSCSYLKTHNTSRPWGCWNDPRITRSDRFCVVKHVSMMTCRTVAIHCEFKFKFKFKIFIASNIRSRKRQMNYLQIWFTNV